jgi:hypothetical protein
MYTVWNSASLDANAMRLGLGVTVKKHTDDFLGGLAVVFSLAPPFTGKRDELESRRVFFFACRLLLRDIAILLHSHYK